MQQKSEEKIRIDQILFQKGLAPSRERAQAMIMAGQVLVNEQAVDKPSQRFRLQSANIRLKGKDHPYVGRGGLKLQGALEHFQIKPEGKICLDIGSSTGGFTDCLLQHGAEKVFALDCGTNQLDYKLRQDPRVVSQENFNARYLKPGDVPDPIDLIVVDVSFISLKKIIPPLLKAISSPWTLLTLIKPQFEAGPGEVEKGGVLRDPKKREKIAGELKNFAEELGLECDPIYPSPLKGDKGNQEYFLRSRKRA